MQIFQKLIWLVTPICRKFWFSLINILACFLSFIFSFIMFYTFHSGWCLHLSLILNIDEGPKMENLLCRRLRRNNLTLAYHQFKIIRYIQNLNRWNNMWKINMLTKNQCMIHNINICQSEYDPVINKSHGRQVHWTI